MGSQLRWPVSCSRPSFRPLPRTLPTCAIRHFRKPLHFQCHCTRSSVTCATYLQKDSSGVLHIFYSPETLQPCYIGYLLVMSCIFNIFKKDGNTHLIIILDHAVFTFMKDVT
ncbi:hypothetical protein BHE74_00058696 [Ensete ventricosum]|nr:hypothetical protein BHE74_00058696 [Ensete ventricosum]RZS28948.1 hypothetical protein BHM03_00062605 [Ensete ventricosum]